MSGPTATTIHRPRRRLFASTRIAIAIGLVLLGLGGLLFSVTCYVGRSMARLHCEFNLRHVGQAIAEYAQANAGAMPPDLSVLLATQNLEPALLICPRTDDTPAAPTTRPIDARAALVAGGHCSYVYVAGLPPLAMLDPADVIAFEPIADHVELGNVLFADLHTESIGVAAAASIEAQFKTGIRPIRVPAGSGR